MSASGEALARAARALVGTRFRLHGHDPATGLDCLGLVIASLTAIGRPVRSPVRYGLHNSDIGEVLAVIATWGLRDTATPVETGDVLLAFVGPLQHHLLVAAPRGAFIHAHAGLRRVVATPGPPPWPILRHWRLAPA